MPNDKLNQKLVSHWQNAASDLGIRVTAPIRLQDKDGNPFECEGMLHDFGSTNGAIVISQATERRIRPQLRNFGASLWYSVCPDRQPKEYHRATFINELTDLGYFGSPDEVPEWYSSENSR
jgi:hypothetical protein